MTTPTIAVLVPTPGEPLVASITSPPSPMGRCLLVPPFGLPAAVLTPVVDRLVDAGLSVVTIDPRNHVGKSHGGIADFTLSGYARDCLGAVTHFDPDCVVAVSLGARAMIRALSLSPSVRSAVYVLPVVDVRSTLNQVFGQDHFGYSVDELPDRIEVLGHSIRARNFRLDCERQDLLEAMSTRQELAAHAGHVSVVAGDGDPWVDHAALAAVVDELGSGDKARLRSIPLTNHMFHEDVKTAIAVIDATVEAVVGATKSVGATS